MGAVGQAQRLVARAVAVAEDSALLGETRRNVRVATLRYAASICELSGALGESLQYLEKAITVAAAGALEGDRVLFKLSIECANLLSAMERNTEADSRWRGIISRIADPSNDHLLRIEARLQYAAFLRSSGREGEATREMIGAFGILPIITRSQGAEVAEVLAEHAERLAADGHFNHAAYLSGEAVRRFSESTAASEDQSGARSLDDVRWQHADYLVKAGKIGEGRDVYESLLAEWQKELPPEDVRLMRLRESISRMEAEVGKFERALDYARENLQIATDDGGETYQRTARGRVASILRMQGRHRDAYEMVRPPESASGEDNMDPEIGDASLENEDGAALETKLRMADLLPMPYRPIRRANVFSNAASELLEDDPEQALKLIVKAEEELDSLAPGLTKRITDSLGRLRARAVANLGGLDKQIEFEERRLSDFVKAHGCSAEMTRHSFLRDLADLHIQNENYQAAEELLRGIRDFLEFREARQTLLYGNTLLALASLTDDRGEAERLRVDGEEIVESLRDQTDFD
jgi:hypothetical protein